MTFEDVDVGAAHSGTANTNDHVERTFDGWVWYFGELEVGVVPDDLHCFHGHLLVRMSVMVGDESTDSPSL